MPVKFISPKDERKVYKNEAIVLEDGNTVRFDGKGNPSTKVLKVYRYYGDINVSKAALESFASENGYDVVYTEFQVY